MGLHGSIKDELEAYIARHKQRHKNPRNSKMGSWDCSTSSTPERTHVPNSTEIRGFVIWMFTITSYAIFLLWTSLPRSTLLYFGVTYYPSKYWAIALPSYIIFTAFLGLIAYIATNLLITPSLDSFSTFTDDHSRKPRDRSKRANLQMRGEIPEVSDLPLNVVNKLFLVYTKRRHRKMKRIKAAKSTLRKHPGHSSE